MTATHTADDARPLVSIVIGVLNGEATLERCLASLAAQTLRRLEVVVQDGGSTDGTLDILRRYSAHLAPWRSEPDAGLYDAWNRAIGRCRGDWIGFLGCDDELADAGVLERLVRDARPDATDLIASLNAFVDGDGRFLKVVGHPWSWRALQRRQILAHAGLLHNAAVFERLGGFDTSYRIGGDYDLLLRLGPETRAAFVDQITVRVGSNGMSHRLWTRTFAEHWRAHAARPDIGPVVATRNYAANVARFAIKKLRGRR